MLFAFTAALLLSPLMGSVAHAQEYKIAVVDMPMVIKDYKKRESLYAALEKEVSTLQSEIEAMGKDIDAKKAKFEAEASKMEDDARFNLKQEIESQYVKYKSELERRQRLIDSKEEAVLKEVLADIKKAIQEIAAAEGYHLVLNSNSSQGAVVYSSETIDVTSKVLAKLNK
jgi:outer membrane protein